MLQSYIEQVGEEGHGGLQNTGEQGCGSRSPCYQEKNRAKYEVV